MKNILKDIWDNYKVYLIIYPLFIAAFTYYGRDAALLWKIIAYLILSGGLIKIIIYAIKKHKKSDTNKSNI